MFVKLNVFRTSFLYKILIFTKRLRKTIKYQQVVEMCLNLTLFVQVYLNLSLYHYYCTTVVPVTMKYLPTYLIVTASKATDTLPSVSVATIKNDIQFKQNSVQYGSVFCIQNIKQKRLILYQHWYTYYYLVKKYLADSVITIISLL